MIGRLQFLLQVLVETWYLECCEVTCSRICYDVIYRILDYVYVLQGWILFWYICTFGLCAYIVVYICLYCYIEEFSYICL
jgi:hypothetical protein